MNLYIAVLVVIFGGVMPAVIYFVGVACELAALRIVRGANFLSAFDKPQQDALAKLIQKEYGIETLAPARGESFELK